MAKDVEPPKPKPIKKRKGPLDIDPECVICFNKLVDPCKLDCDHAFCLKCIKQSRQYLTRCPICRVEIPGNFEMKVSQEVVKHLKAKEEKAKMKEMIVKA